MKRLLLSVPALALAGCIIPVGGAEVGDLRVTWSFDGAQVCEKVGVDNVTIQLIEKGKEGKDGAKAFGQTAECIAGSMVIPDIVAGTYVMTAVGTGEVAVFDNGDGVTLDVVANQQVDASAPLTLANGEVVSRIEFQYNFNGEALCSAADVATINTQVIADNGVAIAGSNTDCITGLVTVEGIRVGEHKLRIEAADGDGNVRFSLEKALLGLQPGETLRLDPQTLLPTLGDVTVSFNFDDQTCSQAGVDNVDVQIIDGNRVLAAQNVPCIDGRATFTDMPLSRKDAEGNFIPYTVHIDGLDGNDEVLFSAEADLVLDGVDDEADAEFGDDITVELDAERATVTIPFKFPNGASCADVGVNNVDIQIIDSDDNTTGTNVACIAGDSGPLIVVPGSAQVRIDAISGDDVAFSFAGPKTIADGDNVLPAIELTAVRSTLLVSWDFATVVDENVANAAPPLEDDTTSCIKADIDTVIVRVFRGQILQVAQAVDCDEGRLEMPGLVIDENGNGPDNLRVELEGIREQEGDAPYFIEQTITLAGARTERAFRLEPVLVFVFVVWAGDCGNAGAATVDVQIDAAGINSGINMPCAQGSQKFGLPLGAELSPVTIKLRGVTGLGQPTSTNPEIIGPVDVLAGINTFRFAGPTNIQ